MRGVAGVAALGAAGIGAAALLRMRDAAAYAAAAAEVREPPAGEAPLQALLRYATLAANSHNTQPWRFALAGDRIALRPDLDRRTPVVDPDDHHLHASLGCALENMLQAAGALGLHAEVEVSEQGTADLHLTAVPALPGPLFGAIPRRQSTRAEFDGSSLSAAELHSLAATGEGAGVAVLLVTEPARVATLLDLVVAGNAAQMRDAAFMAELLGWIRFSHAEATARRDGMFAGAAGNPALPQALGEFLFPQVFTLAGETDRHVRQIRSSAGLAVIVADRDAPAGWLRAGQVAQRFCLQATALGLRTAWLNQPVEVPGLREALAAWLGITPLRPDFLLRFGRGPALPFSLRRRVAAVSMQG
jgi:nitroreductase